MHTRIQPFAGCLGATLGAVTKFFALVAFVVLAIPAQAFAAQRHLSFDNTEPLAAKQWYLQEDQAWGYWLAAPSLKPVKVAIIDSGIDYSHPEFVGRVIAGKSFVGGSWKRDTDGHGTFIAGVIAANPFNDQGIAGLAFNARLLIAKVVMPDGTVSLKGEIAAIKWAADHGARVINLSLGGVRDPLNGKLNMYSDDEQRAIDYASRKGALVVAALGNGSQSPGTPWPYADYPAALPHVIGVSADRKNGSVPQYSNRDDLYNDLTAPGDNIFSTVPRNLIDSSRIGCSGIPYSDCGPEEFRGAIGTSFSAPQVVAAAAVLIGVRPSLRPDQVSWLLERTARDTTSASGCPRCPKGRDRFTGWGRLDIKAAVARLTSGDSLPTADQYEPNDDAGVSAARFGPPRRITATLDYWDDQRDVYAIKLTKGQQLFARLSPLTQAALGLFLWNPGTKHIAGAQDLVGQRLPLSDRAAAASRVGAQQRIAFRAPKTGTYYLEALLNTRNSKPAAYQLAVATRR